MSTSTSAMSDGSNPTLSHDIVVGFAGGEASIPALQQAIAAAQSDSSARLVVVHASSSPIRVYNGPPPAIARAMGEPAWSTVYATVLELGAVPERTLTVIEPGEPVSVLARHCHRASLILLGPSRRRLRRRQGVAERLSALVGCSIVEVAEPFETSSPRLSRTPERDRSIALQAGVAS